MANNYKNYKIDFTTQTIVMDYKFAKLAQDPSNDEYRLVKKFKRDFPEFNTVVKSHRRSSTSKRQRRLTYTAMKSYMRSFGDESDQLLAEFKAIKNKYNNSYAMVNKWFNQRFPDYGEIAVSSFVPSNPSHEPSVPTYVHDVPNCNPIHNKSNVIDAEYLGNLS